MPAKRGDNKLVYNTRDYWGFGLCLSSGIIKTTGDWIWLFLRDPTECLPLHLRTETDLVSETLGSLVFRTPDDGQSPVTW
jgi:hypothetical protein